MQGRSSAAHSAARICTGAAIALSLVMGRIPAANAEAQASVPAQHAAVLLDAPGNACLTGSRQSPNASPMVRLADATAQIPSSVPAQPVGIFITTPVPACLAGSCQSHRPVPFNGSLLTTIPPCITERTFSNGDKYSIRGVIAISENSDGTSLPGTLYLKITFLGGTSGGPSLGTPDEFVLHYYLDYTSNGGNDDLTVAAIGSFSAGVAAKSTVTVSALYCGTTKSKTLGPISPPPDIFSESATTFVSACPTQTLVDTKYKVTFQKGTKPSSFIQVGNTNAE